uniref:Uncharacterized protein n=1 Tax=Timema bartmani TaxID=61472 RepID=A0A7R9EZA3_9NEOP|nr:unnamed protein product [Timema bartmani]
MIWTSNEDVGVLETVEEARLSYNEDGEGEDVKEDDGDERVEVVTWRALGARAPGSTPCPVPTSWLSLEGPMLNLVSRVGREGLHDCPGSPGCALLNSVDKGVNLALPGSPVPIRGSVLVLTGKESGKTILGKITFNIPDRLTGIRTLISSSSAVSSNTRMTL